MGTDDDEEGLLRLAGVNIDNADADLQAILREILEDSEQIGQQLALQGSECEQLVRSLSFSSFDTVLVTV